MEVNFNITNLPVQFNIRLTACNSRKLVSAVRDALNGQTGTLTVQILSSHKRGFHFMSYQANFASHHTGDRHVVSSLHGIVLEKQQNVSLCLFFYFVHTCTTLPNYNRVTRISAHTTS